MLKEFQECLKKNGQIKANSLPYYVKWVVDCYSFLDKPISEIIYNEEKRQFLTHLFQDHEDWQIKQVDYALKIYSYFLSQRQKEGGSKENFLKEWKMVEERAINALRLRHRSILFLYPTCFLV